MKETPKRRITSTSSSNEIFTEQLGKGGGRGPPPLSTAASEQIYKDDENIFPPPRILSYFLFGFVRKGF
jgi:hypothetical protein